MGHKWNGESAEPYKVIEIGQELLAFADHLVERRDAAGLRMLDKLMSEFMASGIWASDHDLLALGEYAEVASRDLEAGKTVTEIRRSEVRKRAA